MSPPFTINLRERAARALWEEQNVLEADADGGWENLDDSVKAVARHDVEAVLFALIREGIDLTVVAEARDSFFEYAGGIYHGPSLFFALRDLVLAVSAEDPESGWSEALAAAHSNARRSSASLAAADRGSDAENIAWFNERHRAPIYPTRDDPDSRNGEYRSVSCSLCNAPAGAHCRTWSGHIAAGPHQDRVRTFLAQERAERVASA